MTPRRPPVHSVRTLDIEARLAAMQDLPPRTACVLCNREHGDQGLSVVVCYSREDDVWLCLDCYIALHPHTGTRGAPPQEATS